LFHVKSSYEMRLSNYVGNTPLLPIKIGDNTIWGKAEFMNPGGSVKDRMATYILNDAEANGKLKPGDTLVEATSGNTGIAFAMLAAERGYTIYIVMPSDMSEERKKIFQFYGARLIEVDPGDFDGAIEIRNKMAETQGFFNCNQFHNPLNILAHYNNTGVEIWKQWKKITPPDALVLGTGTGGTLMGVGRRLKEVWPQMKIVAVEPAESPVMSGGEKGLHGIQGIGDGSKFLVDLDFVDDIVQIPTDRAKDQARLLANDGLFVGISAGANVLAAQEWLLQNEKEDAITILCDRGERYFSCL
jgi:cysteine synthase A